MSGVLDRLSTLFKTKATSAPLPPLPEADIPLALGALLVRVAKSDKTYAVQEISQIDRVLAQYKNVGPIEAAKMRALSERLEASAPDTEEFAAMIKAGVPYQDRLEIIQALWGIVYADGVTHSKEEAVMAVTQTQLGIEPADCDAAKTAARPAP